MTIEAATIRDLVAQLGEQGRADIEWSENIAPPESADAFAGEAIYVICNSGMHHKAGRSIYERVMPALRADRRAGEVFGHVGKAAAMDEIWANRLVLWGELIGLESRDDMLDFCRALPWVGKITAFHLAKNFGADVAKPDRHLQRLADAAGETVQGLCDRLAAATGYRSATIDLILWRACATGLVDSKALG